MPTMITVRPKRVEKRSLLAALSRLPSANGTISKPVARTLRPRPMTKPQLINALRNH